jgi:hypothetical protein
VDDRGLRADVDHVDAAKANANRRSAISNRQSAIGNRQSAIGNRHL